MNDTERDNLLRIFKIKRNQIAMMKDRNYINTKEMNLSYTDEWFLSLNFEAFVGFIENFMSQNNGDSFFNILDAIYEPKPDRNGRIEKPDRLWITYLPLPKTATPQKIGSVGVDPIKNIAKNNMESWKATTVMMISMQPLGVHARKKFAELEESISRWEFYMYDELTYNITEHFLVPKHRIITDEEKRILGRELDEKGDSFALFPGIAIQDPMMRWLGGKINDIVMIERENIGGDELADTYITYRRVVNRELFPSPAGRKPTKK